MSLQKLAPSLIEFNKKVGRIAKDEKNPFFKNNYATLDQIIDVVRPILNENKLAIMQNVSGEDGSVTVKTTLLHESGEFIESTGTTLRLAKNDPQGAGAGITYARRYDLCAFLSLNTGDDDDGNSASGLENKQQPNNTPPQNNAGDATRDQLLIKFKSGGGNEEQFNDWYAKQTVQGFNHAQMNTYLTKKLREINKQGKQ